MFGSNHRRRADLDPNVDPCLQSQVKMSVFLLGVFSQTIIGMCGQIIIIIQ
jgi:hypothetical protein